MIEYIRGEITELLPTYAVIETSGVGYGINISLNTFTKLQGKKEGKLFIYENIREDAYALYGFFDQAEREMFVMLTSVSGIGSNTARTILSEMSVRELCAVISQSDVKMLKGVKGIGPKTAQRIIVELKDKINTSDIDDFVPGDIKPAVVEINDEVRKEAIGALTMLGFAPAPTNKTVNAILKENPSLTVEEVVKSALKQIK